MAKWQEIASGTVWDLTNLRQYEPYFEEGEMGLLELDLRVPVSEDIAQQLEDKLKDAGVENVMVTAASPMLKIYFKKGFPWLAVIAAITIGLIVLAILIVGWRLFVEVPGAVPLFVIAGLGILALLVIWGMRKVPT